MVAAIAPAHVAAPRISRAPVPDERPAVEAAPVSRTAAVVALLRLARSSAPDLLAGPSLEAARRRAGRLLAASLSSPGAPPTTAAPPAVPDRAPLRPAAPEAATEPRIPTAPPFRLLPPVTGRLAGRFGELLPNGVVRKGITLSAVVGDPVRAPASGRIAFAGPFRGYGVLLILDHGDGYHTVMTGIADLAGGIGRRVDAGEPVGRIADPATGLPELSFELWRHRQPIDPLPGLSIIEAKENG